jgi:protein-arginine kinase activator protein McsA
MNTKECKKCKVELPIDKFEHTDKAKKYRRRVCKTCNYNNRRAYQKKYYKDHYIPKRKPKVQNVETLNAPVVEG